MFYLFYSPNDIAAKDAKQNHCVVCDAVTGEVYQYTRMSTNPAEGYIAVIDPRQFVIFETMSGKNEIPNVSHLTPQQVETVQRAYQQHYKEPMPTQGRSVVRSKGLDAAQPA